MNKIKIFQSEITDGVGDQVASQASVAYCSPATLHSSTEADLAGMAANDEVLAKILAEN